MRDINDILPKLPKKTFGAVMNFYPDKGTQKNLLKTLPYDSKWHTILRESKDVLNIDGVDIRQHGKRRYT